MSSLLSRYRDAWLRIKNANAVGKNVDALKEIRAAVSELLTRSKKTAELRSSLEYSKRLGEDDLAKLDSSVKKNNQLTKRLRAVSDETVDGLLEEIAKTNQSRYISEVVAALADNPFRARDLTPLLSVCCCLHGRYADFTPGLQDALVKAFHDVPDEEKGSVTKRKSIMRLLVDAYQLGLLPDLNRVLELLSSLVDTAYRKLPDQGQARLAVVTQFARLAKDDLLPWTPLWESLGDLQAAPDKEAQQLLTDIQATLAEVRAAVAPLVPLTPDQRQAVRGLVLGAFERSSDSLVAVNERLRRLEEQQRQRLAGTYALSEDMTKGAQAQYEAAQKAFEGLHRNLVPLAECLGVDMPELRESEGARLTDGAAYPKVHFHRDWAEVPLWDSEEERRFYEDLPDLPAMFPALTTQVAAEPAQGASEAAQE